MASNKKPDKRNDGNKLTLLFYPSNKRNWRTHYRINGRVKECSFAYYSKVEEVQAFQLNGDYQKIFKNGFDSKLAIIADSKSQELTFKYVAEQMLQKRKLENKKDGENIRRLNKHISPAIGNIPHYDVTKQMMQENIFDPIIKRGTYAEAKKTNSIIKLVFNFAITEHERLRFSDNPALKLCHPTYKLKPFDAIIEELPLPQFVKDIWAYRDLVPRANIHTANLLILSLLLYLRSSEIRTLTWPQYDEPEQVINAYASNYQSINASHRDNAGT